MYICIHIMCTYICTPTYIRTYISYVHSIMDAREFEWESQLRFYWKQEPDELIIQQCTGEFGYGYEYMGLNGRLVITPLTDRIYLTLTQVMCHAYIMYVHAYIHHEPLLQCKYMCLSMFAHCTYSGPALFGTRVCSNFTDAP